MEVSGKLCLLKSAFLSDSHNLENNMQQEENVHKVFVLLKATIFETCFDLVYIHEIICKNVCSPLYKVAVSLYQFRPKLHFLYG
jgi:hypothetical protein